MKNTQTITDFDHIVLAQVLTLNKHKFLNLGFEDEKGDMYMISIPEVMVKKFKKEDVKDGKSRVRRAGLQEATESETSGSEEQTGETGGEGEDTGTATE